MIRAILLESPYGNDDPAIVERNVRYADACQLDALRRGEAPHLGHLLYTRVLNDRVPAERAMGIAAHLAWMTRVDAVVFYVDHGLSRGMRAALEAAYAEAVPREWRKLGQRWETAPAPDNASASEVLELIGEPRPVTAQSAAEALRVWRGKRTLRQVAPLIGCAASYLNMLETGKRRPGDLRLALRLQKVTGIAVESWDAAEQALALT